MSRVQIWESVYDGEEADFPVGELTLKRDGDLSGTQERVLSRIERTLARATSVMRSEVGRQYDLPFPTGEVPEAIKSAVLVVAKYMLLSRRDGGVTEATQDQYDSAMRFLDEIGSGEAELFESDGDEAKPAGDSEHVATGTAGSAFATHSFQS
jgi:phage gp36-like protein